MNFKQNIKEIKDIGEIIIKAIQEIINKEIKKIKKIKTINERTIISKENIFEKPNQNRLKQKYNNKIVYIDLTMNMNQKDSPTRTAQKPVIQLKPFQEKKRTKYHPG